MKKFSCFYVFLFLCFYASCVPHEVEPPDNLPANVPPGNGVWQQTPDSKDGHYNVRIETTANDCGFENGVITDDWDFIDYGGGRGRIEFVNNNWSYWPPYIEIEIEKDGKFNKTITFPPFRWPGGGYVAYKMEIKNGIIAKGNLFASITYSHFKGADENVTPYCKQTLEADGFQRFRQKQGAAKTTEGEYSAKVAVKKNTCTTKEPPERFTLDVVPQEGSFYNLRMWDFLIADLSVAPDGKFNDAVSGDVNSYAISGELTPEEIRLELSIKYGYYACEQELEIRGAKRFEESDGKDEIIDGVYGVWTHVDVNTCDDRPPMMRFHLDAIAIDEKSARLVIGNKDFMAKLDGEKFDASYSETVVENKFSGTITPDAVDGTLSIDVTIIDFVNFTEKKCSLVYKVNGYKLYKHN